MSAPAPAPPAPEAPAHDLALVAGTFDRLHAGHALLLDAAFRAGRRVEIWVSDDAMVAAKATRLQQHLHGVAQRCAQVAAWCDARTARDAGAAADAAASDSVAGGDAGTGAAAYPYRGRYSLHELRDAVGPAADVDASRAAIVCSEETLPGCEAINAQRAAAGRAPLCVVVVPVLRGADGCKLSSSALRAAAAAAEAPPPPVGASPGRTVG